MMHLSFLNVSANLPLIERQIDYAQYYTIGISIFLFISYIIVKVFFAGYYKNLFYVALRQDTSRASFKESNSAFKQADLYILLNAVISLSAGLFTVIIYYPKYDLNSFLQNNVTVLLFSIIIVTAALFFKWLTYSYFGWLLNLSNMSKSFLNSFFYSIRIYGIINFPIFLFVPFVGQNARIFLTMCMLGALLIVVLYNFYTYWQQSIKIKFFNHYTILYFCIFEILPILICIKISYIIF